MLSSLSLPPPSLLAPSLAPKFLMVDH